MAEVEREQVVGPKGGKARTQLPGGKVFGIGDRQAEVGRRGADFGDMFKSNGQTFLGVRPGVSFRLEPTPVAPVLSGAVEAACAQVYNVFVYVPNAALQPIYVDQDRLRIQGVVIGVLRKY